MQFGHMVKCLITASANEGTAFHHMKYDIPESSQISAVATQHYGYKQFHCVLQLSIQLHKAPALCVFLRGYSLMYFYCSP